MTETKYSKIIVAAVIALNVIFAAAVLMVFYHTGQEPATLVAAWFTFTTSELWALSKIKRSESARKKDKDE